MKEVTSFTELIKRNRILEIILNEISFIFLKLLRSFINFFSKDGENTVIIAIHKLGDSVFTFAAINEIKKKMLKKFLYYVLQILKPIYELIHPPELVIEIPKDFFFLSGRISNSSARKILKNLRPGRIIDLTGVMTSAT